MIDKSDTEYKPPRIFPAVKIMRTQIYQKQITTEYFKCPACNAVVEDIDIDFNSVEDWITFECPFCGQDLQVEPPKPEGE